MCWVYAVFILGMKAQFYCSPVGIYTQISKYVCQVCWEGLDGKSLWVGHIELFGKRAGEHTEWCGSMVSVGQAVGFNALYSAVTTGPNWKTSHTVNPRNKDVTKHQSRIFKENLKTWVENRFNTVLYRYVARAPLCLGRKYAYI